MVTGFTSSRPCRLQIFSISSRVALVVKAIIGTHHGSRLKVSDCTGIALSITGMLTSIRIMSISGLFLNSSTAPLFSPEILRWLSVLKSSILPAGDYYMSSATSIAPVFASSQTGCFGWLAHLLGRGISLRLRRSEKKKLN